MSDGQDTEFSCSCGALSGEVSALSPDSATHIVCFCPDCRAAEVYFGQTDPEDDGVHLAQLNPSDVSITNGEEHLALLRLYSSGIFRWYAACCNAPLFNTVATPKVRFISIMANRLEHPQRLGSVKARAFEPTRKGKVRHHHAMRMIWPIAVRSLAGLISGEWRETPLFDPATGKPIREAKVLTSAERQSIGLRH